MTNLERQLKFETIWAERHSVPLESMVQYRFKDQDGYRLPSMAAHYRTFCAALEMVVKPDEGARQDGFCDCNQGRLPCSCK